MTRSKQPSLFPSLLPTDEAAPRKKKEAGALERQKLRSLTLTSSALIRLSLGFWRKGDILR